ncbi:sensor histidine kinase [Alkaliphilus peptidifermentans]|uniref:histidine kinase n=1 Tax=Alkaliphilus peptidifermentans DSM 18978 TaxID=1120976 RepID=A0A1G5KM47_9FIRM|nr:PAS domain-containing sensor histidine kinase [Alkaliphilus peptidifermentans]SCZ01168.1 PAS domain-containing protein [Alkaliphilus peptidifermentans DSM 18978]
MKYQELSKDELIHLLQERDETIKGLNSRNKTTTIKEKNQIKQMSALEYDNQFYYYAFDAIPVGLIIIDKEYKIIQVNQAILNLCNANIDLIGEKICKGICCLFSDITFSNILNCSIRNAVDSVFITGSSVYNHTVKSSPINREEMPSIISLNVIKTSILNNDYAVITVNSITQERNTHELRKEIIHKKLMKEIDIYNQLQTAFISNISHEFKTPLNIIFSTIQLLQFQLENKKIETTSYKLEGYIETMKQNSYRLLRLINNLIDITKLDSGLLEPQLKRIDIIMLLENIMLSLGGYIKNKNRILFFNTDIDKKIITCDSYMMERIILNLLSNAVKFTKPGDKIWVNVSSVGDYILISVKDTGIGIPNDKKKVIFNRFRQANPDLNRSHEGSGIGLSLVKSLVEIHGGKIYVESQVDVGSKFIIKLPTNIPTNNDVQYSEGFVQEINVDKIQLDFCDIYK